MSHGSATDENVHAPMNHTQSGRWLAACLVLALATLAGATAAFTVWWGWLVAGVLLAIAAIIATAPVGKWCLRTRQVLLAVVAAAVAWLGIMEYVDLIVWASFLAAATFLVAVAPEKGGLGMRRLALGCLLGAGMVGLAQTVQSAKERVPRNPCSSNLRQIGLALHNYHDEYGTLPPPYLADEEGRPMHSWRVLILPHIEQKALYERYDFDEPWDGPNNRLLADAMPPLFRCPRYPPDEMPGTFTTSYVALVGSDTIWAEGNRRLPPPGADDQMLLVVETFETGIHWMEPRDVAVEEHTIPAPAQPPLLTAILWGAPPPHPPPHPGGRNVLFADGAVRFFPFPLTPESLATLASVEADPKIFVEPLYPQPQEPTALERYLPGIRISGFLVTVLGAIGFGIALARARFRGEGGG